MENRVTIAIPVYNGGGLLQQAIQSAVEQSVPVDVRVFDNASTDGSADLAAALLGEDAVTVAPENLGAVENFNRAVRETSGDYFAWLAHDDFLDPKYVETCLRVLEENPGAPACLTGIQFTDSSGAPTRVQTDETLASASPKVRTRSFLRRRRWTETYCLYRREWLKRSPLFSDEHGADVLLTWWFLLRAPLAVTSEPLLHYREYPLASSSQANEKAEASLGTGRMKMKKLSLWWRLYELTFDPDIQDSKAAKAARRQLFLMALWPGVIFWAIDDVLDAAPWIDRLLRRGWERLGAPGRIAPTS